MATIRERFKNAYNAFFSRDPTAYFNYTGNVTGDRPDRTKLKRSSYNSIISMIYNRISLDVAAVTLEEVLVDEEEKFSELVNSPLTKALTKSANIDQTGRAFIQDGVMSMFDEGSVALVPTLTSVDPHTTDSYDIYELRTGRIVRWAPREICAEVYNDRTGRREQIWLEKRSTVVVENPFYAVMNEPNSTAQRLMRVLAQLDSVNTETAYGKLDLILQLPYSTKFESNKKLANRRRNELESQLTNSKYGVGYIDASEKVVQLNRSLENNLWTQAKDLTAELLNQLGLTADIFNGTADEATMLNYNNRVIEPILAAFADEMERKWLTSTAITQGHRIMYINDPFKLVPTNQIAEIADKFTRNEILTSNEIRSIMGMKPSEDPKADELINSNLNHSDEELDNKESVESDEEE